MPFTEISDDQVANWKEEPNGAGLATFRLPLEVSFTKGSGLIYRANRYRIERILLGRRQVIFWAWWNEHFPPNF